MNQRTALNFSVDLLAFVGFVLLTATGLVERYVLPPGTGDFQAVWGMNRHQWGEIHFWIALFLMGVLAIHIVLHWKWIVCVIRGKQSEASAGRFGLGVVGLIGLLGLSLAPFLAPVEQTGEPGSRRQQEHPESSAVDGDDTAGGGERSTLEIRGSMTLSEVEQATDVPATEIIRKLGLPPEVPRDENLGKLRRQYKFDMQAVRDIVHQSGQGTGGSSQ